MTPGMKNVDIASVGPAQCQSSQPWCIGGIGCFSLLDIAPTFPLRDELSYRVECCPTRSGVCNSRALISGIVDSKVARVLERAGWSEFVHDVVGANRFAMEADWFKLQAKYVRRVEKR
jgi:hypothetical protein